VKSFERPRGDPIDIGLSESRQSPEASAGRVLPVMVSYAPFGPWRPLPVVYKPKWAAPKRSVRYLR
jgi:hypothetical protein